MTDFLAGFNFPERRPIVLEFIRVKIVPVAHPDKMCVCDFKFMPTSGASLKSMVEQINNMQPDYAVTILDAVQAVFGTLHNMELWSQATLGVEIGRN